MSYTRSFRAHLNKAGQLAHLHQVAHLILTKIENMEANMALLQSDVDNIANEIDSHVANLASEIQAIKDAHPDVDLSGLDAAVKKLSDLDLANTVKVDAPAETAPVETTPATDAPVADTPVVDAPVESAPVDAPASTDTASTDAPVSVPADQDVTPAPVAEQASGDVAPATDTPVGDPTATEANAPANAIS